MAACLPASVVIGRAVKNADKTMVSASMPNHFGTGTIDWKVSRGATITPMTRATRLFGAGVEPAAGAGVVIRFVRERSDCTTPYTTRWDEMFPDRVSELSRGVRFTESNEP